MCFGLYVSHMRTKLVKDTDFFGLTVSSFEMVGDGYGLDGTSVRILGGESLVSISLWKKPYAGFTLSRLRV